MIHSNDEDIVLLMNHDKETWQKISLAIAILSDYKWKIRKFSLRTSAFSMYREVTNQNIDATDECRTSIIFDASMYRPILTRRIRKIVNYKNSDEK